VALSRAARRRTIEAGGLTPTANPEEQQMNDVSAKAGSARPFLSDVKTLRAQARKHIEKGPITHSYGGDIKQAIDILQSVLATELVCVLRYTQHSIVATGLSSEGVKAEFAEHAREEQGHAMEVAERINQLGGAPDFNPQTLTSRSAAEYSTSDDLVAMIRENLVAERIAVEHYRELVRYFGDNDPATRVMIEGILSKEEEHASDMLDLLVKHGGLS
jgi:bacterioferritin